MSFIRWGEHGSEVYVFEGVNGFEILGGQPHVQILPTIQDCIAALLVMRDDEGYRVPREAFERLMRDYG